MNSLINKMAILLTVFLYNTAQTPGISDKQVHAEFVIAHGDLSSWTGSITHQYTNSTHA